MKVSRKIILSLVTVAGLLSVPAYFRYQSKFKAPKINCDGNSQTRPPEEYAGLRTHAELLKSFNAENNFNTEICFLINFKIASGKKRFFVYNMVTDSVWDQGLVAHGRCNERWLEEIKYGNEIGCGCSSRGRYKIGYPYKGRFGLAYKLVGLDKSNNNAYNRFIVLHAHECVPEVEAYPLPICQSDGCPTVSLQFMQRLRSILDKSEKPVLLWIF